jgi:hypothetical protein
MHSWVRVIQQQTDRPCFQDESAFLSSGGSSLQIAWWVGTNQLLLICKLFLVFNVRERRPTKIHGLFDAALQAVRNAG